MRKSIVVLMAFCLLVGGILAVACSGKNQADDWVRIAQIKRLDENKSYRSTAIVQIEKVSKSEFDKYKLDNQNGSHFFESQTNTIPNNDTMANNILQNYKDNLDIIHCKFAVAVELNTSEPTYYTGYVSVINYYEVQSSGENWSYRRTAYGAYGDPIISQIVTIHKSQLVVTYF